MNIQRFLLPVVCSLLLLLPLQSCNDDADKQAQAEYLKEQVAAYESTVDRLNASILCYQSLLSGEIPVGITATETGYKVELSGGKAYTIGISEEVDALFPLIAISEKGNWMYSFDDGNTYLDFTDPSGKVLNAYSLEDIEAAYRSPQLLIDSEGYWKTTCDDGTTYAYLTDASHNRIAAFGSKGAGTNSLFGNVVYNETAGKLSLTLKTDSRTKDFPVISNFYLKVKGSEAEDGLTFFLNEERVYEVETSDVVRTRIKAPDGWTVKLEANELTIKAPAASSATKMQDIHILITSSKQYQRTVTLEAKLLNKTFDADYCNAWKEFVSDSEHNVLPDFSYAGYMHGEVAPPEMEELIAQGYKVFNVCDYGAVPDDEQSDREAFLKALEAAGAKRIVNGNTTRMQVSGEKPLNAIIYFPEGEYVLQTEEEVNKVIDLTMGGFVLKGAGRNRTTLKMNAKNTMATPGQLWSCPTMLAIKHYSGVNMNSDLTQVTADTPKGGFEITVGSTANIKAGAWICLYVKNNTPEFVAKEIAPHPVSDLDPATSIVTDGAEIYDLHQVASVNGNKVTFKEPIMHTVEAKYNWVIKEYKHYEDVGVEDLAFEGKAEERFQHHEGSNPDGSGSYDSDYKLIELVRLTNSWMRRVNFVSVSEATSLVSCANVSAYDIEISGNRGHSAVRSNASSRAFIGKVYDHSGGYRIPKAGQLAEWMDNAGQYHGCGVSKPSMGAVIWNVQWGDDSCFESHASQPRATLIDRCTGAFIPSRQGGDRYEVPNHLGDLIIWNMNATRTGYDSNWNNQFVWWDKSSPWTKTVPPVIIGFHGASINFAETFISDVPQTKRIESQGNRVEPYSLYEAQLRHRLGYVPAWLTALK